MIRHTRKWMLFLHTGMPTGTYKPFQFNRIHTGRSIVCQQVHISPFSSIVYIQVGQSYTYDHHHASYVANNTFSGTIHTEIGNLTTLFLLDLSSNTFTGTLPKEIGLLTSILSQSLISIFEQQSIHWFSPCRFLISDSMIVAHSYAWCTEFTKQHHNK